MSDIGSRRSQRVSLWQKCPVCDGTGLVSRPPYVAGDVSTWVASSAGPWTCRACNGVGMVVQPLDGASE